MAQWGVWLQIITGLLGPVAIVIVIIIGAGIHHVWQGKFSLKRDFIHLLRHAGIVVTSWFIWLALMIACGFLVAVLFYILP